MTEEELILSGVNTASSVEVLVVVGVVVVVDVPVRVDVVDDDIEGIKNSIMLAVNSIPDTLAYFKIFCISGGRRSNRQRINTFNDC